MLGTLAKWLRIIGFDTYFADQKTDDLELLKIAKKQNRVLITRDKELIQRCKKQKIKHIQMFTTDLDEQIKQILKNFELDEKLFLTRCLLCNSIVTKIDKKNVFGKVPKKVFENNDDFWYCKKCDKIYWMGTHTRNMLKKIKSF